MIQTKGSIPNRVKRKHAKRKARDSLIKTRHAFTRNGGRNYIGKRFAKADAAPAQIVKVVQEQEEKKRGIWAKLKSIFKRNRK